MALEPVAATVKEVERAVREWIAALPPGVAATDEKKVGEGAMLHVRPLKAGAMDVAVGFASPDAVELYWGNGFRAENVEPDLERCVGVLRAIRQGRVREEEWTVGSVTASIVSLIETDEGTVSSRLVKPLWILQRFARRGRQRTYAPWD